MDRWDKPAQDFHSGDSCACPVGNQVNSEVSNKKKRKKQKKNRRYLLHSSAFSKYQLSSAHQDAADPIQ